MQKVFEMRIIREFFQRPPILFAAFVAQFRADSGEVQSVLMHDGILFVRAGVIVRVQSGLVDFVIVHVAVDGVVFAHIFH